MTMDDFEVLMVVEYLTRTMIEPKRFVFDCLEDSVLTDQVVFINTLSAETLTVERRNLDYMITKPYTS
jgi:hypothetical protein